MSGSEERKHFFDVLGKIAAIVTIIVTLVLIFNNNFHFLTNATILQIFGYITAYGNIILLGIVGYEAVAKMPFAIRILFLVAIAVVVLAQFWPDVFQKIIDFVTPN